MNLKYFVLLFCLIFNYSKNYSQTIYSKAYGNEKSHPIIFLHGGPGYNSVNFEVLCAKKLSLEGFYVIVYDRRGEGRNENIHASYSFEETFDDLDKIYKKYNLKKATLIGHSFGGVIATKYAQNNISKVSNVILVGTPVNIQETFKTIINTSKVIYEKHKDSVNLNYINILENMDTSSLQYASYCFIHAMTNNFYYPKVITKEAESIYNNYSKDSLLILYSSKMNYKASYGFWENEKYSTLNIEKELKEVIGEIPVYGVYGADDGLFSENQIHNIENIIGFNNFILINNCSHNVFIDQQNKFLKSLNYWLK